MVLVFYNDKIFEFVNIKEEMIYLLPFVIKKFRIL